MSHVRHKDRNASEFEIGSSIPDDTNSVDGLPEAESNELYLDPYSQTQIINL